MPIYSYICESCGRTEDIYRKVEERNCGPECHGPMKKLMGGHKIIKDLEPYLDADMTDKPVWVKSKKHRKQLMKKHDVYEDYGKGWR